MKIVENDGGYVELQKSTEPGKIIITIQAKDVSNPLKTITNSIEITMEQYKQLISDI